MGKLKYRGGKWLSWWAVLSVRRLGIGTRDLYCQFCSNRETAVPQVTSPQSCIKATSAEQNQACTRNEMTNWGCLCNCQFQSLVLSVLSLTGVPFLPPSFPPVAVNVEHHLSPQLFSTISLPDSSSAAWAIPEHCSLLRLAVIIKSK